MAKFGEGMKQTSVLIAGAGPVGMTLAFELATQVAPTGNRRGNRLGL